MNRCVLRAVVALLTVACLCEVSYAGARRRVRRIACCNVPLPSCCPASCAASTTNVYAYCTGTCKDGTSVGGNGSGATYAAAQTNANNQITLQCASRGGVQSFDTCVPYEVQRVCPTRAACRYVDYFGSPFFDSASANSAYGRCNRDHNNECYLAGPIHGLWYVRYPVCDLAEAVSGQPVPTSLTLQESISPVAREQIVFDASGCDVAHGGQGNCENGVWTVNLAVRAWKDIYGPYVRVSPGKYDAYVTVEMTGYANVRNPRDPDAYMTVVYFDAVSNTGSTFHRNGAVTERDYNQHLRDHNGVFRTNITTNGAPNGPINLPNGANDLEVRLHFHRSVASAKVIRVWIEKVE